MELWNHALVAHNATQDGHPQSVQGVAIKAFNREGREGEAQGRQEDHFVR